jgi:hypothetical protein
MSNVDKLPFNKLKDDIRCKLDKMCNINSQLQEVISRLEDPSTDEERSELMACRDYLEKQVVLVSKYISDD